MKGLWVGWRQLPYGPHKVTVKAVDNAQNVSVSEVIANRVPYGDGEDIRTLDDRLYEFNMQATGHTDA